MKFSKEDILAEIKRTAEENGGMADSCHCGVGNAQLRRGAAPGWRGTADVRGGRRLWGVASESIA